MYTETIDIICSSRFNGGVKYCNNWLFSGTSYQNLLKSGIYIASYINKPDVTLLTQAFVNVLETEVNNEYQHMLV